MKISIVTDGNIETPDKVIRDVAEVVIRNDLICFKEQGNLDTLQLKPNQRAIITEEIKRKRRPKNNDNTPTPTYDDDDAETDEEDKPETITTPKVEPFNLNK